MSKPIYLEDITPDETIAILQGTLDEDGLKVLNCKLKGYSSTIAMECLPIFTRNLKVLLNPWRILTTFELIIDY